MTGAPAIAAPSVVFRINCAVESLTCRNDGTPMAAIARGSTMTLSSATNASPATSAAAQAVDFPAPLSPNNITQRLPAPRQAACSDSIRRLRASSSSTANSSSSYRAW